MLSEMTANNPLVGGVTHIFHFIYNGEIMSYEIQSARGIFVKKKQSEGLHENP